MGTTTTTDQPAGAGTLFLGLFVLFYLAALIAMFVGWVFILRKAGYSGWLVLLGLVPLVGVVMFFVFAFKKWPVTEEVERLRAGYGYPGGYGAQAAYAPPYGQQPWGQPQYAQQPYGQQPYGQQW